MTAQKACLFFSQSVTCHEDTPVFIDYFARELLPTEETGSGSTSTVEIPHPDPSSPGERKNKGPVHSVLCNKQKQEI